MHGLGENWTGCLLARAINLQLEVSDKWDGKKKAVFWLTGTELLGLCPGPPCSQVEPEELLLSWFPWEREESSPGDKPRVLLGGTTLCPSVEPRKMPIPNLTSSLLAGDAAFGSLGLKFSRSWGFRQPFFFAVKQGWNVGSEFPLCLFLSSWAAAVGTLGRAEAPGKGGEGNVNPLNLILCCECDPSFPPWH